MQKTAGEAKRWSKPEFKRLGTIANVAGGKPTPIQNKNNS
jgi:hypothetical protein